MYYISDILQIKTCFHFFFHTTRTFWNAEPTKSKILIALSQNKTYSCIPTPSPPPSLPARSQRYIYTSDDMYYVLCAPPIEL